MLMGSAMGATIIAIALSPWGKQSEAHFNPAVTFAVYRLGKVTSWDAVFYCAAQLSGAVSGVALASLLLHGPPAHHAVRYAATLPGIYGDAVAFAAELIISFHPDEYGPLCVQSRSPGGLHTLFRCHPGCGVHCFRIPGIRYERESCPDIRPRVVRQILARSVDLFHRAAPGYADGG